VAYLKSQSSIVESQRNILLKLEYCGTNFVGWQQQAKDRTVQGVLKENLEKFLRHKVKITGSGRTDAGVHALAQHANFITSSGMKAADIKHRLNRMLPPDIVILLCREVPLSFDSRRQALWRSYRYLICERLSAINKDFAWVIDKRLDLRLLYELAALLSAATQFENFCKTKSLKESNECQIFRAAWTRHAGYLRFDISANRFLHNMVRLLVGTMVAVCDGRMSVEHFKKILNGKIMEKSKYISPACGLYLAGVGYERGRL
jgi:tRNA pseudouridine38-40 synthase